jgi:hypothetical protein
MLSGGSTKRLVQAAEFVPLPMSINTIDGTGKLLTSPDQVKEETCQYWEKLYGLQLVLDMDKPWLQTKSVNEIHGRVTANPFQWPRKASLTDYCALIRKEMRDLPPVLMAWKSGVSNLYLIIH